jgi:hypothetical protein
VAEQTLYVCKVTGRTYKTERGARNSEARESVKLRQRDYAKENASTLEELMNIIIQKSKEFYGWDVVVHHVSEIKVVEKSKNDLGLRFKLSFNLYPGRKVGQRRTITHFLCDGFSGLQQHWYDWRTFRDQNLTGRPCNADMFIPFKDFPRIHEKYQEYISLCEHEKSYRARETEIGREAEWFTMQLPELQKQNKEVNRAYKYLEEQRKLLQEIRDYNTRYYMELWRRSEGPGPNIPRELEGMFGNHC